MKRTQTQAVQPLASYYSLHMIDYRNKYIYKKQNMTRALQYIAYIAIINLIRMTER